VLVCCLPVGNIHVAMETNQKLQSSTGDDQASVIFGLASDITDSVVKQMSLCDNIQIPCRPIDWSQNLVEDCECCHLSADNCHYKEWNRAGSCETALLSSFHMWAFQCSVADIGRRRTRSDWWRCRRLSVTAADLLQSHHGTVRLRQQSSQRAGSATLRG